ncbi:hypothetical protein [Chryseobacterium hagamense]|uniref:Uncharacterized protein n=1 Tax=Chryseobacterium hagamense TaxID=395935 RepID=A0A511YQI3_9FLAO|nr:hypothetical protein [Chryseobacterium hagamense]GEN77438.1 hypothetical protein CHA01nite_31780 [Chryseobacterium hagamense]
MISSDQENQIAAYLLSRKLSPQILTEVKDHFLMQIDSLMEKGDMSFQEAFLAARISWQKELEMVKADFFSFRKIARIEKELLQKRFGKITVTSLAVSLASAGIYVFSGEAYYYFQIFALIAFVVIVLFGIFSRKIRFIEYQRMSLHPLIIRNMILGMLIFPAGCYFSGEFEFWKPACNQLVLFYSLAIQVQLLYFRIKKINVLVQ